MLQNDTKKLLESIDRAREVVLKAAIAEKKRSNNKVNSEVIVINVPVTLKYIEQWLVICTEAEMHLTAAQKRISDIKAIFLDLMTLEYDPQVKEKRGN